jgi:hypothetical protein
MMWQPDLDNFDFAYNCLNWLSEGKRTHVLFLEEGQIQDKFEIPLKEPPLPPLPPLKAIIETADKGLVDLERHNAFNKAIGEAVANLPWPDKWVQQVVLMSTLGLAIFGLARLTQARQRHDKALMLARSSLEKTPPAISLIEQRNQSLLQEGNYWESARALARQALDAVLGPQQVAAGAAAKPPPLPIRGRWRHWKLRRRIDRLWRLAYGAEPFRISSRQLKRLALEIETLKTLLARLGLPRGPSPTQHYNTDERKVAE